MQLDKYIKRLLQLDRLVRLKATGSPKELAKKLNISERMVFEYILEMKQLGAPIKYCFFRKTYMYTEDVKLEIGFRKKNISPVFTVSSERVTVLEKEENFS